MFQAMGNGDVRTMQFRYDVSAKQKVNAYKPKPMEDGASDVRYSQFGATFSDYHNMLQSANVKIVWEAGCQNLMILKNRWPSVTLSCYFCNFAGEVLRWHTGGTDTNEAQILLDLLYDNQSPDGH